MAAPKSPDEGINDLHKLLLTAVPRNDNGNLSITHLAKLIPCSRAIVWVWIREEKLPADRAKRIVEISKIGEPGNNPKGRVSLDQFHKYVYGA